MHTPAPKPKYIFIDPNTHEEFIQEIRRIIIDKLLTLQESTNK